MANIDECTVNTHAIQDLSDNPNASSGLSAEELKAAFDSAGDGLKNYINSVLRPAVNGKLDANTLINRIYPVGSIYMSVNSTSPATLFGGTWERIQDRFLLSAGSSYGAGTTGGAATVTLTTNQIPAHTHGRITLTGAANNFAGQDSNFGPGKDNGIVKKAGDSTYYYPTQKAGSNKAYDGIRIDASHEHSSVGGNQAHNNMPPYLAVYVWKRTG
jgi:hypothetical protein